MTLQHQMNDTDSSMGLCCIHFTIQLQLYVLALKMASDADWALQPPLKLNSQLGAMTLSTMSCSIIYRIYSFCSDGYINRQWKQ